MNKNKIYLWSAIFGLLLLTWFIDNGRQTHAEQSDMVKIALREVGHQLLLLQGDSTSLVLPVVALDNENYKLSFEQPLSIDPEILINTIRNSYQKAELPEEYILKVIQCFDFAVSYSYKMTKIISKELTCKERILPKHCYTIETQFTDIKKPYPIQKILYLLSLVSLFFLIKEILNNRVAKEKTNTKTSTSESREVINSSTLKFFPEQNKMIIHGVDIPLSNKECELLIIFMEKPNQIIKRGELSKRVWEDKGVIVGRSLDTYISKLRKKLSADENIKLTNVHGVGYKLEIR